MFNLKAIAAIVGIAGGAMLGYSVHPDAWNAWMGGVSVIGIFYLIREGWIK